MKENPPNKNISILYVDDEQTNLNAFDASFRRRFSVHLAKSVLIAKEILANKEIHVIITDQRMPEVLGTELLEFAVLKYPLQSRILLTAYSDINALETAVNKGRIYQYLKKPWNENELIESIEGAYEVYELKKEMHEISMQLMDTNRKLEEMLKEKLIGIK